MDCLKNTHSFKPVNGIFKTSHLWPTWGLTSQLSSTMCHTSSDHTHIQAVPCIISIIHAWVDLKYIYIHIIFYTWVCLQSHFPHFVGCILFTVKCYVTGTKWLEWILSQTNTCFRVKEWTVVSFYLHHQIDKLFLYWYHTENYYFITFKAYYIISPDKLPSPPQNKKQQQKQQKLL